MNGQDKDGGTSPVKQALAALREAKARIAALEAERGEAIAVVGLACRYPGAPDAEAFWRLLDEGRDATREVPPGRWDVAAWYDEDPDAPGRTYVKRGGFLDDIEGFDAAFFGITPREALSMDPQQRMLLEVGWEALENAGIAPGSLNGAAGGVFVGMSCDDHTRLAMRDPAQIDGYTATGNIFSTASGRLSYTLGLTGPSVSLDTACSSSLVAVHQAIQALRQRDCDFALAGGVNALLRPEYFVSLGRARVLAPDGRCKSFDAAADGFGRAEGCGLVVLKRLSDARRDGDRVLAVLRGSAVNQDGRTSGLTVPGGPAQQALIRTALARAGLDPDAVDYIEAHGTGTALGDPIELNALGAVFADRPSGRPLHIGAVKTNLGHPESAAGVAGLIKVVLALRNGRLPATLHFTTPNPHVPWDALPLRVVTENQPWPAGGDRPRVAGVSAFGFGGTNAHVVIGEAPEDEDAEDAAEGVGDRLSVLPLSAQAPAALSDMARAYAGRLGEARLCDVAASAARGRSPLAHRLAVVADSAATAARALDAWAGGEAPAEVVRGQVSGGRARLAMLFSGQGAQKAGMGRGLYASEPAARAVFDRAQAVLADALPAPLLDVMFGDAARLRETRFTQPALYALEVALAEVWRGWGVEPTAVLGHSVGEFAAAHVAGVFSFDDGLRLVAARGRLMQALPEAGGMVAVQAPAARVEAALAGIQGLAIAGRNGPASVVVAGREAALAEVVAALEAEGVRCRRLEVSHAFHSPLMEPMLEAFRAEAAAIAMAEPRLRLISNVTGAVASPGLVTSPDYWVRHVREAVRFADGMEALRAQGCGVFLEVGPGATLLGMGRACLPEVEDGWVPSLDGGEDAPALRRAVAGLWVNGVEPDWRAVLGEGRRVDLPTYPFQRQRFWLGGIDGPQAPTAAPVSEGAALYEIAWEETAAAAPSDMPVTWLLTGDATLADALAPHLPGTARQTATVVDADLAGIDRLVWLAPTVCSVAEAQSVVCDEVLPLLQAARRAEGVRVWLVTRDAVAAADGDRLNGLGLAPLWAMARTLGREIPDTWGGIVDLDAATGPQDLAATLAAGDADSHVALRDGARRVPRLRDLAAGAAEAVTLRDDGATLITGGLGALGLRMARWLFARGCRHVILMGRRAPGPEAEAAIAALRADGLRVDVAQGDVADADALRAAVAGVTLRGVVHAAGVVTLTALEDETPEGLAQVLAPKTVGGWLLHDLTQDSDLDVFILFSSISALWGSKTQIAYGAANGALDALAVHRRARGLPALSVNWGPWGGGGMATDDHAAALAATGVRLLDPEQALAALDRALAAGVAQAGVADVDWPRFRSLYESRGRAPFLDRIAEAGDGGEAAPATAPLRAEIEALAPARRTRHLTGVLRGMVAEVLRVPVDDVAAERGFFELGIDSFLSVDLNARVGRAIGARLPATTVFEHPTCAALAAHLLDDVLGMAEAPAEAAASSAQDPIGGGDVEGLSDADLEALIDGELAALTEGAAQ